MSADSWAILAAAVVVFLGMLVLPIIITRKRLRNEWARYHDSKKRFEEMQAAKGIDPDTTGDSAEEGSSSG